MEGEAPAGASPLGLVERRILGVLVEKARTVPDTYPLSLNALLAGVNQKTARVPVMEASDAEVLTAVDGLKALSLVFEGSGSRVVRYEHNLGRVYRLDAAAVALLATLLLRGAQTSAELRLHAERLQRFADIAAVEGFLEELAAKEPARVLKLPRAPGAREVRWAHLLCGEVAADLAAAHAADGGVSAGEIAALKGECARLADEVQRLREWAQRVAGDLGVPAP